MAVQAQSRGCLNQHYVVKADGRPLGEFRHQWVSEGLKINLMGHRHLTLRKASFWGNRFELVDEEENRVLGTAEREGLWRPRWVIELAEGDTVTLLPRCLWSFSQRIERNGKIVGSVKRQGICGGGWTVNVGDELSITGQLMVGLLSQVLWRRETETSAAGG